jgi:hypothetical protein
MFYERLSGKSLLRLANVAAGVSFMLYGYDAGVLGGVQSTKPFLDAIGVRHSVYDYIIHHDASITGTT